MHYQVGQHIESFSLQTITDATITIPDPRRLTHLQFRRFAGCPICNIHLRAFYQRADEIRAANVHEVVVFHSSKEEMLRFHTETSLSLIGDADKKLYRKFSVGTSLRSVLDPAIWLTAIRGLIYKGVRFPKEKQNPLGLPADFLIDQHGKILACKYGVNATDKWSVDEVLGYANVATTQ